MPAMVPGVARRLALCVQILRPAWGYGSDVGGRRTPWIIGGMAALALGGTGAALATALRPSPSRPRPCARPRSAFLLVGVGAGAAGTSVLAMLASAVAPARRAAAATTVWVMMIFGFAITAPLAGHFLDPFCQCASGRRDRVGVVRRVPASPPRGLGPRAGAGPPTPAADGRAKPPFRQAFAASLVASRRRASSRSSFLFRCSPIARRNCSSSPSPAWSSRMTPGATTKLAGLQHGGVLIGHARASPFAASAIGGPMLGSLAALDDRGLPRLRGLRLSPSRQRTARPRPRPLRASVFALGVSNGVFAVAAIGSMMALAGQGAGAREGTRMGLWGAAQAVAFGLGGFAGTVARRRRPRAALSSPLAAYDASSSSGRRCCSSVGRDGSPASPRGRRVRVAGSERRARARESETGLRA